MDIDRNRPIPLYLQLKAVLKKQIYQGALEPGTRLSSERDLCETYEVSRTTVRQALREMEQEGLIKTVPGRGTFIAMPDDETRLDVEVTIQGFTSDMQRQGLSPSSVLLDASLISDASAKIKRVMSLSGAGEVISIKRLRLINNKPLALHFVYLNHRLCPNILHHNLAEASLFELLRNEYNLTIAEADEYAYAALANDEETSLLDLPTPAAVLRTERITRLDTGQVIEYAKATYCGEWYRLRTHIDTRHRG
jgi:GntR family transcriptional regulator